MAYMSEEGYQQLVKELRYLEAVERPKIKEAIAEARDKGDLSENAEYDAACQLACKQRSVRFDLIRSYKECYPHKPYSLYCKFTHLCLCPLSVNRDPIIYIHRMQTPGIHD